jgi:hypothetical protein
VKQVARALLACIGEDGTLDLSAYRFGASGLEFLTDDVWGALQSAKPFDRLVGPTVPAARVPQVCELACQVARSCYLEHATFMVRPGNGVETVDVRRLGAIPAGERPTIHLAFEQNPREEFNSNFSVVVKTAKDIIPHCIDGPQVQAPVSARVEYYEGDDMWQCDWLIRTGALSTFGGGMSFPVLGFDDKSSTPIKREGAPSESTSHSRPRLSASHLGPDPGFAAAASDQDDFRDLPPPVLPQTSPTQSGPLRAAGIPAPDDSKTPRMEHGASPPAMAVVAMRRVPGDALSPAQATAAFERRLKSEENTPRVLGKLVEDRINALGGGEGRITQADLVEVLNGLVSDAYVGDRTFAWGEAIGDAIVAALGESAKAHEPELLEFLANMTTRLSGNAMFHLTRALCAALAKPAMSRVTVTAALDCIGRVPRDGFSRNKKIKMVAALASSAATTSEGLGLLNDFILRQASKDRYFDEVLKAGIFQMVEGRLALLRPRLS